MCGITGYVNLKQNVLTKTFIGMNNIIRHRGPDDEGYTLINQDKIVKAYGKDTVENLKDKYENIENLGDDYSILLGHRRLSILDLSEKGHQPMCDQEEKIHIVFNGEIYNYIEIREELKEKGYEFHTNCDTEVILYAYQEWGESCVKKFNGMWAFIIFDKEKSQLFCSRDRFGVKPFYYYYDEEKILFASEIKQILEETSIKRIANDSVIYHYLFYGVNDYNEDTFFKNVYTLPASFNMTVKLDFEKKTFSIQKEQYYVLEETKLVENEEKIIKEFQKEFQRSIQYRLRSDIAVGSCLSGGLDSSSVVTEACKQLKKQGKNKNFQTFTACYDENPQIDERYFSKKVVQKSECVENLILPNHENFLEDIQKVIWHQDIPFPSLSIYAQWCVMKGANRKNIKVLLDGQGADETLLGYERYAVFLLKDNIKKLKLKSFCRNYRLLKNNLNMSLKKMVVYFLYFSQNRWGKYWIKSMRSSTLNKEFVKKYQKNVDYVKSTNFKNCFELHKTELFHSNLLPLLRYEDRNSMAFSIETRVPFLDYQLVELETRIPVEYKIKDGWTKHILRQAMKEDMEEEVVFRKNKLGFVAPQKKYIDELDETYIENYLQNMKTKKYFKEQEIRKIFQDKTNDEIRWKFLNLEIWMDLFDVMIEE